MGEPRDPHRRPSCALACIEMLLAEPFTAEPPVKAPGRDDTLFALRATPALVEVVGACAVLAMLAHRRDIADALFCNRTFSKSTR